jgi:hypothetical protein
MRSLNRMSPWRNDQLIIQRHNYILLLWPYFRGVAEKSLKSHFRERSNIYLHSYPIIY